MDAVIPSIGDKPIAFGFIGVAAAIQKVEFDFVVFRNAVFPFEFANPRIVRVHFVCDKFFELFVSFVISAANEQFDVVAVFGGPIVLQDILSYSTSRDSLDAAAKALHDYVAELAAPFVVFVPNIGVSAVPVPVIVH